jgi:hypothetical protein
VTRSPLPRGALLAGGATPLAAPGARPGRSARAPGRRGRCGSWCPSAAAAPTSHPYPRPPPAGPARPARGDREPARRRRRGGQRRRRKAAAGRRGAAADHLLAPLGLGPGLPAPMPFDLVRDLTPIAPTVVVPICTGITRRGIAAGSATEFAELPRAGGARALSRRRAGRRRAAIGRDPLLHGHPLAAEAGPQRPDGANPVHRAPDERSSRIPDVPTAREAGAPDYKAPSLVRLVRPRRPAPARSWSAWPPPPKGCCPIPPSPTASRRWARPPCAAGAPSSLRARRERRPDSAGPQPRHPGLREGGAAIRRGADITRA